jgi:aconitate decarboxylase
MASAQAEDETLQLATFLSKLTYEDLPKEVIEHAKRAILNILGCALGSANASPRRKALGALLPSAPVERASGAVTIWGRPERTNLDDGAILNGIAATTADYDDTHLETVIHVACTAIAAVLPFAEAHHLSGKEVILAFVAAVEAQCAVALAVSPSSYANGW